MPTTKHKRKATAHAKSKTVKSSRSTRIITTHPKLFVSLGLIFVLLGLYLLAFESQDSAMFGFAMLSLIVGAATAIYANFVVPKKSIG